MKSDLAPDDGRRLDIRAPYKKLTFTEHLAGFWRDLEDDQRWKYDELCPVQLLEKLKLDDCPADKDELARAEFFWSRRPRVLPSATCILWFIVPLGLPLWLLNIAAIGAIGVPLLILTWLVVEATGIVGSVRWRRQYELSIDRLIRQFGRSGYSKPSV